ncbi:DNA cytosine methyltransferase [Nannocystaceae bacterium ST9]
MFAGAAGSSLGARSAGMRVIWAANHSPLCVATHLANFPEAEHVCEDLIRFDHGLMPKHDALIASPVCRGHSQAGRPGRKKNPKIASKHNRYRATAWSVIDACEIHEPRVIVVENVPDWRSWKLYHPWRACLESLGYTINEARLTASRWGVPQRRERLFVVGLRKRRWIEQHLRDPDVPEPGMHDAIDWDAGDWLDFRECEGDAAREQLRRAHREFAGAPSFVEQVSHRPIRSSREPIRTMTTKDQLRLVHRGRYRSPTTREAFNLMGFPRDYVLPEAGRSVAAALAGDAVCPPVMEGLLRIVLDAI